MSTSESKISSSATSVEQVDINKQNKELNEENLEVKSGVIEEDSATVNGAKLASISEKKRELPQNSTADMPNKTAPSRRIPHLHKLEK